MTLRKCIWCGGQFISPLFSSNLLFLHIQLHLFIGLYCYPMFTSLLYPRNITKRRSVSHWRRLLTVTVSVSLGARPGSDHRSRSRDLAWHCAAGTITIRWFIVVIIAVYIYDRVTRQKESFFHCHSCLETSLFGHHVQRAGGVWKKTEKIKSSKI